MSDQLRLGERPPPTLAERSFATDDFLAAQCVDLEAVLRGATAKIRAVRRHLDGSGSEPEPDPHLMRMALEHLATPDSWIGDPRLPGARLAGARSVFEIAVTALGR